MQTSQLNKLCESVKKAPVILNVSESYEVWQTIKNARKESNRLISVLVIDNYGKHLIPSLACKYKDSMIYLVQNNIYEGYIILYITKDDKNTLLPFGVLTMPPAVAEQMFQSTFEIGESSKYKMMQ